MKNNEEIVIVSIVKNRRNADFSPGEEGIDDKYFSSCSGFHFVKKALFWSAIFSISLSLISLFLMGRFSPEIVGGGGVLFFILCIPFVWWNTKTKVLENDGCGWKEIK